MNMMKTGLLLAGMTGLFMAVGFMIGGQGGMIFALLFACATNLFSYWFSDRVVLGMYGAQEVSRADAPRLYDMTAQLAANAGIPMPRLYIINDPQPNAFATGRNPAHGAVAVHSGLMDMLSEEEVAGVIAHELAHIANRDTLTMTLTATIAGAISMLGNMAMFGGNRDRGPGLIGGILIMVLAPMAAMVVQMAISRTREYAADHMGGQICGNPLWLASGLKKIAQGTMEIPNWNAEANPATAHMFIMNPLSGRNMDNLFTTHPDTDNRIAALIEQAREMGLDRTGSAPAVGPWGAAS